MKIRSISLAGLLLLAITFPGCSSENNQQPVESSTKHKESVNKKQQPPNENERLKEINDINKKYGGEK